MADWSELKRLADACAIERCADEGERDRNLNEFCCAVEPEDVAALIAENEALTKNADCLDRLAVANKALADSFQSERDQLKAELERVRADAERLRKLLAECTDALESEILDRYGLSKDHPAMRRKFERDMQEVIDARAAMGKGGGHSAENQAETRVNAGSELAGKGGGADA